VSTDDLRSSFSGAGDLAYLLLHRSYVEGGGVSMGIWPLWEST